MNSKTILIAMAVFAALAVAVLTAGLMRIDRGAPSTVPVDVEVISNIPEPAAVAAHDYSAIVSRNIFFAAAPEKPKEPAKEAAPAPTAAENNPLPADLQMLGGYPDEWPRLKLTGVFLMGGKRGVIINGGDAVTASTGTRFDSLYHEGDEIGGGVKVGKISSDAVILIKNNQGWSIALGADPPVVVKKK